MAQTAAERRAAQRRTARQLATGTYRPGPVGRRYQAAILNRDPGFRALPRKIRRRPSFRRDWFQAYGPRRDGAAETRVKDTLYDFAKREDTPEAWDSFRDVYNDWFLR